MKIKINILLLILTIAFSCCSQDNNKNLLGEKEQFDTIYFASERSIQQYQYAFLVEGAIKSHKFLTFKTIGEGSVVWIDSVLFKKKSQDAFFTIVRQPTQGYYVLYYNGDSLSEEIIAKRCPSIYSNTVEGSNLEVIIRDSIYNSGYFNNIYFKYILSNSCLLLNKEEKFIQDSLHFINE